MKKNIAKLVGKEIQFNFASKFKWPCFGEILKYENDMVTLKYIVDTDQYVTKVIHEGHIQNAKPLSEGMRQYVLRFFEHEREKHK